MRIRNLYAASVLLMLAGLAPAAEPAGFTRKPTAVRDGDAVRIEFAVDRETDVAVFIEDAGGRIVRHLVAGVLGKIPPPPLQANSLAQTIVWDGKADYGKPADGGPFKVRVALGLGARYDREIIADPMALDDVQGMAVGPDGTLYAVTRAGAAVPNWSAQRLIALNRDGTFQRTLIPLPSNATEEQIEALGGVPVEVGGRTVPMVVHVNQHRTTAFWSSDTVAMTPSGQLLVLHPDGRIGMVDVRNSGTLSPFLGPPVLPDVPGASFRTLNKAGGRERCFLACSSDGTHAYFNGLSAKGSTRTAPPWPAVYRVRLPDRSPAQVFFGNPEKAGSDDKSLGEIVRGMASDGKGHLLICDPLNKRVVVVAEADGTFVGSFPAENPELVAADPETGAIYLLTIGKRNAAEVVKLASWKAPSPVASIHLEVPDAHLDWWWRLAADTKAKPAVLWVASRSARQLLRIEDLGDRFSDAVQVNLSSSPKRDRIGDGGFVNLTVDHYRDDPEIYVRCSGGYAWWTRYNEKTDKTDVVRELQDDAAAGSCLEVGPDGNLYVPGWPAYLCKFDRNGKPLKWDVPFAPPEGAPPTRVMRWGNAIFVRVIMVYMTHTLGIRPDGHLFMFEGDPIKPNKDATHALFEYAPSGQRVGGPIIWKASDSVIGPRFDQEGNIYVAEQIRPADQLIPPEFAGYFGPVKMGSGWRADDPRAAIAQMYGSIVKFSPKGGAFDIAYYKNQFGEPKLDPSFKTIECASWIGQVHDRFSPNRVTGALWMHMGVSQINLHYCNCENTRFDVDPFGRVWYPDLGRYRVGVLDTNGNLITTFGSYGNAESRGPDSPVVDPKTGKVRPRRADDPKELQSPFAEPEIAFAWLIGVGATDRYAYMGDSLNRRLLRAKLVYAAEETCEVK